MSDVEKLNINNTDYDIADAKALRNKDTAGTGSFIDTRAGTTEYPTTEAHTESIIVGKEAHVRGASCTGLAILGNGAYANMSYSTAIGYLAHGSGSMTTAIGYNAYAGATQAVAIGSNTSANSTLSVAIGSGVSISNSSYSILIGSGSGLSGNYSIVMGYGATVASESSVAFGRGAKVGRGSNYSVAIGYNATVSDYNGYCLALGSDAKTTQSFAVQIGAGTNSNYGSLKFRDYLLVKSDGKIPEERLPDGIKTASPVFPNLYDINEEEVSEQSILYTGETKGIYKNSQFYRGRVRYGYPHFNCSWIDSDWLDSPNDVMIDHQKFFTKLAEVTKQRIGDNDVANGLIGGGNAEQTIYLEYDADNDYYFLHFDDDSLEQAFNGSPDNITDLSFDDLADYGIYFKNFHMPEELGGEYEICDIYYYAPAYIDGYDWNDNPNYINYFKLMGTMADSDYGFSYVINNMEYWEYEVDGTTHVMPVIPETYISAQDSDEYDNVTVRWEWDDGSWYQYINGENIGYNWTTAEMYTMFGIKIDPGQEENVDHVEFYFRGGDQRYWEQFNPIDETEFAKQEDFSALETQVQPLLDWKVNTQTGSLYNLNNYTTPGWYYFPKAGNVTNRPSTVGIGFMLLVQKNTNNVVSQHLFACVANNSIYDYETSMVYSRVFDSNYWYNWQTYLTTGTMCNVITGYDKTKKQYLVHDANSNRMKWEDAQ